VVLDLENYQGIKEGLDFELTFHFTNKKRAVKQKTLKFI
jgi:hypothetical protein